MLLKKTLFKISCALAVIFTSFQLHAQNETNYDCNDLIRKAKTILTGSDTSIKDEQLAVQLLTTCADSGQANAQFILGLLYKKGYGSITINEKKSFKYIEKAALQEHPYAVCELGVLYKDGIGCKLNFDTAISWFTKADQLGNHKGSYSIGYVYFKGLGSITQDYDKAIEWFSKSSYPMAQHWLGICNYFGYGMPVDKEKAMKLLLTNPYAVNSEILANHLETHPDLLNLGIQKENTIKATEFSPNKINEVVSTLPKYEEENINISKASLIGEWKGKLVELDWSGKKMNRSFPITLNFSENKQTKDLNYEATLNNSTRASYGVFLDNSFYFDNLNMALPRLYQDNNTKYELDYSILAANTIEIKEINNMRYLIANIDTQVLDWSEPGPPMLLILSNSKALTDNGQEIDQSLIEALAQLKEDSFISLYPNPFKNDLLIQYDLEEDSTTRVEIYTLDGIFSETIVSGELQKKGTHLYHVNGSLYPQQGLYIVKITTDTNVYTKLIIKE